jgi:flagellar basal-body rod protein FlgG
MTAASGMKAQQMQVDSIANNIANANTSGFKKTQLSFRSLLYQTLREPGAPVTSSQMNPTGLQIGSGTEVAGSFMDFHQGELEPTGGMYDLALQGTGFFRIRLPNGEFRYTRDGSFRIDGNGQIVTPEGYVVETAPTIPTDTIAVTVGEDGTVAVIDSDGAPPQTVGTLNVFRFPNPAGLKAQGGNLFSETASSGASQQTQPGLNGAGTLRQGNSRAIRASDEMLQQVNQMIR